MERQTILVAAADAAIRSSLSEHLRAEGFAVREARTGREVLARLAQDGGANLVLLDVRLPERGGLEVLKDMRERGLDAGVLVFTASGPPDQATRAMRLGAYDCVI